VDAARWDSAPHFDAWLETVVRHRQYWLAAVARATIPDDLAARARALTARRRLVVLTEDWCGDAIDAVPVLARLAACTPALELRCLRRDLNLDLMDEHLTDGTRQIPKLLAYDDAFAERGSWGPRPAALQAWVVREGMTLTSAARYEHIHAWHARDGGRGVVTEVLDVIERGAADTRAANA
jgi:hypothetical protein